MVCVCGALPHAPQGSAAPLTLYRRRVRRFFTHATLSLERMRTRLLGATSHTKSAHRASERCRGSPLWMPNHRAFTTDRMYTSYGHRITFIHRQLCCLDRRENTRGDLCSTMVRTRGGGCLRAGPKAQGGLREGGFLQELQSFRSHPRVLYEFQALPRKKIRSCIVFFVYKSLSFPWRSPP